MNMTEYMNNTASFILNIN